MSLLDKTLYGRITFNGVDSHTLGRGTTETLLKRAGLVTDKQDAKRVTSILIECSVNEIVKPPKTAGIDPTLLAFAGLDIPLATPEEEAMVLAYKDRNADPLFQTYLRGLNMRKREQMVGDEWRIALNHVRLKYPDIYLQNDHLTR